MDKLFSTLTELNAVAARERLEHIYGENTANKQLFEGAAMKLVLSAAQVNQLDIGSPRTLAAVDMCRFAIAVVFAGDMQAVIEETIARLSMLTPADAKNDANGDEQKIQPNGEDNAADSTLKD